MQIRKNLSEILLYGVAIASIVLASYATINSHIQSRKSARELEEHRKQLSKDRLERILPQPEHTLTREQIEKIVDRVMRQRGYRQGQNNEERPSKPEDNYNPPL